MNFVKNDKVHLRYLVTKSPQTSPYLSKFFKNDIKPTTCEFQIKQWDWNLNNPQLDKEKIKNKFIRKIVIKIEF